MKSPSGMLRRSYLRQRSVATGRAVEVPRWVVPTSVVLGVAFLAWLFVQFVFATGGPVASRSFGGGHVIPLAVGTGVSTSGTTEVDTTDSTIPTSPANTGQASASSPVLNAPVQDVPVLSGGTTKISSDAVSLAGRAVKARVTGDLGGIPVAPGTVVLPSSQNWSSATTFVLSVDTYTDDTVVFDASVDSDGSGPASPIPYTIHIAWSGTSSTWQFAG